MNFIGFADNIESSRAKRANAREPEWKCKREETVEDGLPGDADTPESHEDSQSRADFVAKTTQYGRRQIDTVIRCFSSIELVVFVLCAVFKTLTQRPMRLVFEELRPPSSWPNR